MTKRTTQLGFALVMAAGALMAADDLPKGEAVLDKYVELTGGKAAYSKLHTLVINGTAEFKSMGMKGKLTIYTAEPDKHYSEVDLAGVGKITEGSDGDIAWQNSAMQGPRLKDGAEKAEALQQGKFNADLNWRNIYKAAETAGTEQIDGKDCYKVVLTPNAGAPITRWYDKSSGLLLKMSMTSTTAMGDIKAETSYDDYRKEGDIVVAHKMTLHISTIEMVMTVDNIQTNPDIPKDKFDPPAEVKALMKSTAK